MRCFRTRMFRVLITLAFSGLSPAVALSANYTLGTIEISDLWTRPTATVGGSGVGYMTIRNNGPSPDRLLGAYCPIALMTVLHDTKRVGNVMEMREIAAVDLPPGKTVQLAPGGKHLMMMDIKDKFVPGGKISCTLRFENAGSVDVDFDVRPMNGGTGKEDHSHMHMQ